MKHTVPIPIIAANRGMLAAGVPWKSAFDEADPLLSEPCLATGPADLDLAIVKS